MLQSIRLKRVRHYLATEEHLPAPPNNWDFKYLRTICFINKLSMFMFEMEVLGILFLEREKKRVISGGLSDLITCCSVNSVQCRQASQITRETGS